MSSAVAEMGTVATIYMGRKEPGGCCATFAEKLGPGLTMWPGPRSTSVPSGILIHPALWPLQTRAENWGLRPLFTGGEVGPI